MSFVAVTLFKKTGFGETSSLSRWIIFAASVLAAVAVLFLAGLVFALPAHACTVVDKDITADTVWTKAGSPYVICLKEGGGEPVVAPGVVLTIEEGVEVQLGYGTVNWENTNRTVAEVLHIKGALNATGATFTAFNGDGSPTPPQWSAIRFYDGSSGTFSACEFAYGGAGATTYGMLMVDDAAAKVSINISGGKFWHGVASATAQAGGIYFRAGSGSSLSIDGTIFTDLGQSVQVNRDTAADAVITIRNCDIFNVATRQSDWAAMSVKNGSATIEKCSFHDNGKCDLDMRDNWTGSGPYSLTLRDNSFDGGNLAKNPLVLAARSKINQDIDDPNNTFSNYPESHKWAPIGGDVPAGGAAYWGETGLDYVVTGKIYVLADKTGGIGSLTIAPGQNIFFKTVDQNKPPSLNLVGSIKAEGTKEKPISFASYLGGDSAGSITITNYNNNTPLRGNLCFEHCVFSGLQKGIAVQAVWKKYLLPGDEISLTVRNCIFKNIAQNPIYILGDAFDGNNALIDHCLIYSTTGNNSIYGYGYGLYFKGADGYRCSPRVTHTTIANNSLGGVYLEYSNSEFTNCIIFGNGSEGAPKGLIRAYSSPVVTYSCVQVVQGVFPGEGNISDAPLFADPDNCDFHLKSQAGRWDPTANGGVGGWVNDDVTSPCIDAGNPASDYSLEPQPNGGRVNMGAYGNTIYASKSWGGTGGRDTTPPTAPSNLRVTGRTSHSISIAWDASSDASGIEEYIVEMQGKLENFTEAGKTAETYFTKDNLSAGAGYVFRVRAKDKAGNVSDWSEELFATTLSSGDQEEVALPPNTDFASEYQVLFKEQDINSAVRIILPQGATTGGSALVRVTVYPSSVVPTPPAKEVAGAVVDISLSGVDLKNGKVRLGLRCDNPDRAAIYRYDPVQNEWVHLGGTYDSTTGMITVETSHFSTYGVLRDTTSGSSSGGGGGSSSSSTPATPTYKATVSGSDISETKLPVSVNTNTDSAATDLGTLAKDIFAGAGTAVLTVPSIPGVNSYTVGIPAASLSGSQGEGVLTFSTGAGSVTIPSGMLAGIPGTEESSAGITIGQGDKTGLPEEVKAAVGDRPIVQLTLTLDGKQTEWNNPSAPVTVSIPYTPTAAELENPEHIVVWYIDGSGNVVSVPNGRYDPATGTVTFTTTHFSYYAVVYKQVSFKDVAKDAWYSKAVSFIAAREITTGTGGGNFTPDAKLTRGQFIVMLLKAYGIAPDANPQDNFADAGNTWYTGYLAAARRLKISAGVGGNMFAPEKEITRQEMFTLLYNALKVIGRLPEGDSGKRLSDFSDTGEIAPWAKDAMKLLVETGTVSGSGGKLLPKDTTTRAQMAQVLYNLLSK